MRQVLAAFACGGLLVTGVAGCGDDDSADVADEASTTTLAGEAAADIAEPTVVEVAVPGGADGEFAYDTDLTTIEAGPVELRLANGGELEHQAAIFKFKEGESFDSFIAAAGSGGAAAALALVDGAGGPNGVAPGASGSSTQVLEAGDYALLCLIPNAEGVPHAVLGMVKPFSVTGEATDAELAEPDVEANLVDLAFDVASTLPAGATVRATNQGEQVHEMVAYRLADGQTVDDVVAATAESGAPPPLEPAGGIGLVAPGGSVDFTLPDEPGDYVFLCFVPDASTEGGPPHLLRGMATQVTVE